MSELPDIGDTIVFTVRPTDKLLIERFGVGAEVKAVVEQTRDDGKHPYYKARFLDTEPPVFLTSNEDFPRG